MEHKLILGGEQYLPFARSRIKALRATGLAYASQKFEVAGCSIRVSISGDIDYIEIIGGGCDLAMDSGVVGLGAYSVYSPLSFLGGTLHETSHAATYNAAFVPTNPVSDKRFNPGTAGQLSGTVTIAGTKFTGKVPYDTMPARSFSPGTVQISSAPATWERNQADDQLLSKKLTAQLCPASIFTGRCRMYVQAMYGRHLYANSGVDQNGDFVASGAVSYTPSLGPNIGNNIAPSLKLKSHVRPDDTEAYPDIELTTSSGVYLDTDTGKHWLFLIPAALTTTVQVYPLIASSCGEAARKFLASTAGTSNGVLLNTTDREHLEAYILSTCLPDAKNKQFADGTINTVGTWSMGYGWHWNWSGTTADMVVQQLISQPPVGNTAMSAMRATHYRVILSQINGLWGCNFSTVTGGVDWTIARGGFCIAEPNWATLLLNKATPAITTLFECSAPFYAFYLRDELQVCRMTLTDVVDTPQTRVVTPAFFASSVPYSPIQAETYVMDGGECQDWQPTTRYWATTISCGGLTTGSLPSSYYRSGMRYTVNNKTWNGLYGTNYPTESGSYGSHTLPDGTTFFGYRAPPDSAIIEADVTTLENNESASATATVVIPPNDAEAVYLRCATTLVTGYGIGTRSRYSSRGEYGWEWIRRYNAVLMPGYNPTSYVVYGPGTDSFLNHTSTNQLLTTNITYTEPTITREVGAISKLLCGAGEISVTWGSLDQFHNNSEDPGVIAQFVTLSGVSKEPGAVIAPMRVVPAVGINSANPVTPAFVGWA